MEEGEKWHKKTNVREIVFGFNDGTISTLALLAGVTGAALTQGWKTTFTDKKVIWSGLAMVLVGILAAVIPYLIGNLFLSWILQRIFMGG